MSGAVPILEFLNVSLRPASRDGAEMRDIRLRLMPGDIALVRLELGNESIPLADLAMGLIPPDSGSVMFQGKAWAHMNPDREIRLRSRIGRVFNEHGWISNLSVPDNITLCERHNTLRPEDDIFEEAESIARAFGLDDIPAGRPAAIHPRDLRRAEWVRAFLGNPSLIVLERPTLGVSIEHIPLLIRTAVEAASGGSALLWLTTEDPVWSSESLNKAQRYEMRGGLMQPPEGSRHG
ncbi:MAG: hypothetical protein HY343_00280 [Lentisphaerae bacterium]|nr:hypothetical protein [Lentisphaerota bacterium]